MYVCMYVCTHTLLYIYAGNIYIKKNLHGISMQYKYS